MTSEPVKTDDGSFTFHHPEYRESYHSPHGAASEARAKFISPSRLQERLQTGAVRLLDIGLGLGVNCRAACALPRKFPLTIDTLEKETVALDRGLRLLPEDPLLNGLRDQGIYQTDQLQVKLHTGDLRQTLQTLDGGYDLIFHDPFSPLKNSECWTVEVFRLLFGLCREDGALLTYSESRIVRAGMQAAGWTIQETPAQPPHRGGTRGQKQGEGLPPVKGIPFRDPGLCLSGHEIRSRREAELRENA